MSLLQAKQDSVFRLGSDEDQEKRVNQILNSEDWIQECSWLMSVICLANLTSPSEVFLEVTSDHERNTISLGEFLTACTKMGLIPIEGKMEEFFKEIAQNTPAVDGGEEGQQGSADAKSIEIHAAAEYIRSHASTHPIDAKSSDVLVKVAEILLDSRNTKDDQTSVFQSEDGTDELDFIKFKRGLVELIENRRDEVGLLLKELDDYDYAKAFSALDPEWEGKIHLGAFLELLKDYRKDIADTEEVPEVPSETVKDAVVALFHKLDEKGITIKDVVQNLAVSEEEDEKKTTINIVQARKYFASLELKLSQSLVDELCKVGGIDDNGDIDLKNYEEVLEKLYTEMDEAAAAESKAAVAEARKAAAARAAGTPGSPSPTPAGSQAVDAKQDAPAATEGEGGEEEAGTEGEGEAGGEDGGEGGDETAVAADAEKGQEVAEGDTAGESVAEARSSAATPQQPAEQPGEAAHSLAVAPEDSTAMASERDYHAYPQASMDTLGPEDSYIEEETPEMRYLREREERIQAIEARERRIEEARKARIQRDIDDMWKREEEDAMRKAEDEHRTYVEFLERVSVENHEAWRDVDRSDLWLSRGVVDLEGRYVMTVTGAYGVTGCDHEEGGSAHGSAIENDTYFVSGRYVFDNLRQKHILQIPNNNPGRRLKLSGTLNLYVDKLVGVRKARRLMICLHYNTERPCSEWNCQIKYPMHLSEYAEEDTHVEALADIKKAKDEKGKEPPLPYAELGPNIYLIFPKAVHYEVMVV
eukprot:Rmarinus@m.11448